MANQIAAHRFNGANAFLPSPFVSRAEPARGATVAPSPLTSPAPMGLTDLGLGVGGAAYAYNTTGFEGTVSLASFAAFSPGYA
ncbi:MAG TPA: thermopsin family protease, partial [Thermoplasmata archaeon]|nr:thermopsin family protease [Thermoplasmata archaeon]